MRIAVVAPLPVPEVVGGAERLYDGLVEAIRNRTPHSAELVKLPSPEFSFAQLVDSYDAFGQLDLSAFDQVISTKYPSWMVRHENHVVYMLHTLRGLYDTYHLTALPTDVEGVPAEAAALADLLRSTPPGTPTGARRILDTARWVVERLGDDHPACGFPGPLVRSLVQWLDHDALHPLHVRAHFAISGTVTRRPAYFPPGVSATPLLPPTSLDGLHAGSYGPIFTASRLDGPKRIDLIVKAMAHIDDDVRLRIAGTGPDEARLRELAASDTRITFLGRIDETRLVEEYANALAVAFVPRDEDFGLVALEAQLASKPVVTCLDSGGVTELVVDGTSGFVVAPEPRAIASALRELVRDPKLASTLGAHGSATAQHVTWDRVLDSLIRPASPPTSTPIVERAVRVNRGVRPRVVVLSTYAASLAQGGGQLRLNRLVRGLADRFDVDVLALDDAGGVPGVTQIAPHCRETVVARSPEHLSLEGGLGARAPIPISDIAATLFVHRTQEYVDAVRDATKGADLAVLEQPFLLPALHHAGSESPLVYDSQNAEYAMKALLLADGEHAAALVDVVRSVEQHAVRRAELVATCSENDRQLLEDLGPTLASWALVPNGADVFATPFVSGRERILRRHSYLGALERSTGKRFERLAIFVASYHPPNIEAAEAIVSIAPLLPNVAFVLAGSHGSRVATWRLPPNVIVTQVVSSRTLRMLLASADVALNPIRSGGGTNLKILEYFAAGTPVVSTQLGSRGIATSHGEHLFVADTEGDLVDRVRQTIADPDGATERARAARRLVEARYDWSQIGRGYVDTLAECCDAADW